MDKDTHMDTETDRDRYRDIYRDTDRHGGDMDMRADIDMDKDLANFC
jgi:hypothetical protein